MTPLCLTRVEIPLSASQLIADFILKTYAVRAYRCIICRGCSLGGLLLGIQYNTTSMAFDRWEEVPCKLSSFAVLVWPSGWEEVPCKLFSFAVLVWPSDWEKFPCKLCSTCLASYGWEEFPFDYRITRLAFGGWEKFPCKLCSTCLASYGWEEFPFDYRITRLAFGGWEKFPLPALELCTT